MTRGRALVAGLALLAVMVGMSRGAAGAGPAAATLLPDLDQAPPSSISVVKVVRGSRTLYRLAFTSAVENRGRGDVIIVGHRSSRRVSRMTADQLVERVDSADRPVADARVRGVGHLRYVHLVDHAHWHLIGFERYELRSAVTGRLVARDRKSGFCIGNRYTVIDGSVPTRRAASFDANCGKSRPDLLTVTEGLSPGWADDYKANLEGQFVDITSVRAGRYLLVNRTNVDGHVRELRRGNDASSALITLHRRSGASPTVTVLNVCPDSATCE